MHEWIGLRVRLHSLNSKPEYNGWQGDVISVDAAAGRVGVRIDKLEKSLSMKLANISIIEVGTPACASPSVDEQSLARFVAAHSLRANETVKSAFSAEMRVGGSLGGRWCCKSSSLWCIICAGNFAYSGVNEEITDNIPQLFRLPQCAFAGVRKLPGELEAALHLIQRVVALQKPLGQVVLDNLSESEISFVLKVSARDPLPYPSCEWHPPP